MEHIFKMAITITLFLLILIYLLPDDLLPDEIQMRRYDVLRNSQRKSPHIVFILADDLGWNDVGFHEGSEIKTPFMDELASSGVRLDNYYVQPVCSPSRASIMTGLYTSHNGINRYIHPTEPTCLPLHLPTIADSLRQNGYATHLVGKWHLGMSRNNCLPLNRGFDSFFGIYGGSGDYYTHRVHRNAPSGEFSIEGYDFRDNERVAKELSGQYATKLYGNRALEIIEQHANNTIQKPLFLFLSMQTPHCPIQAPDGERFIAPYGGIQKERRRLYAAMVSSMDEAIGNVTHALDKHGMRNNTVIIFSSDNGGIYKQGGNNKPLRGEKHQVYEGGIKAVAFVNSPLLSSTVNGTSYLGLLGAADWHSTLVEGIVGGKITTNQTDGHNMWNAIRLGEPSPRSEYLFSVGGDCAWTPKIPFKTQDPNNVPTMYGSIRKGPWKLIIGDPKQLDLQSKQVYLRNADAVSLFNIHVDPYEQSNVLADHQDVFEDLLNRLKFHCRTHVNYSPKKWDRNSDPRLRDGVYGPWL
ncbi:arylsulfatase B-like [Amphiura filiformis]|uniref:arylsulfatase B-like n=1 Tax=Amphiura filiformis TaxID=82378 RepID=UPI003B2184AA